MILTNKNIYKMSEVAIAKEYSKYLQEVYLVEISDKNNYDLDDNDHSLLSYDDFKDYYILGLVGKNNFIDKLVLNFQTGIST